MKNKEIKFKVLSGEDFDGWVSFDKKTFELLQSANKGLAEELSEKDKTIEELKQTINTLHQNIRSASVEDVNLIHELENQLAEKDKEIKFLREQKFYKVLLKDEEYLGVYPKNMEKIIRHQVCEEIRAFFDINPDTVEWDYLNEILNQVEGDVK